MNLLMSTFPVLLVGWVGWPCQQFLCCCLMLCATNVQRVTQAQDWSPILSKNLEEQVFASPGMLFRPILLFRKTHDENLPQLQCDSVLVSIATSIFVVGRLFLAVVAPTLALQPVLHFIFQVGKRKN